MAKEKIKSGPQIIDKFLKAMEADDSVDRGTIAAINDLWQQNRLNANRLQQELEKVRQTRLKDGQAEEG